MTRYLYDEQQDRPHSCTLACRQRLPKLTSSDGLHGSRRHSTKLREAAKPVRRSLHDEEAVRERQTSEDEALGCQLWLQCVQLLADRRSSARKPGEAEGGRGNGKGGRGGKPTWSTKLLTTQTMSGMPSTPSSTSPVPANADRAAERKTWVSTRVLGAVGLSW